MRNEIIRVARFGVMVVFRRCDYRAVQLPKYVIGSEPGLEYSGVRLLEEFSTKRRALAWAKRNREG